MSASGLRPFPLPFTIYIDDLLVEFEKYTFVGAYADDLLIARSAQNKDLIVVSLLPEVDKVVAWSDKARLTLNPFKCETAFFSQECPQAAWQPYITIDGKRMFCNPFPVFLGVRYDRQLTVGQHVQKLSYSVSGRINLLRALGGTIWGWHTTDRRQVYIVIVRSMPEYEDAAWEPWLSATTTSSLGTLAVSYLHQQI